MRIKLILIISLLIIVLFSAFNTTTVIKKPDFLSSTKWADSVIKTMTLDEKIGQLLMVAAYSNRDEKHAIEIDSLVTKYNIGGLIFMQGGPLRHVELLNRYQAEAKIPLLISIDGEWGLAMRLDSVVKYPWQMTLGAIQDNDLIYRMGKDIGEQCKRIGIQVNFAPVVDVNVNPKNPIINARSFGENKYNVAKKGVAYMRGLQDVNVLANAKHFPGHGDTDADSHKALPIINHSKERIDSIELYPFKALINEGLASMMVAHLFIPSYDTSANTATTLSKNVVTELLKDSMKFEGLVFTDALNMKGVSSYFKPGIVDVKALLAGNDVLLFSENVPVAIDEIKKAILNGEIDSLEVEKRCLKILKAKEWSGVHKTNKINTINLTADLNKKEYELLNKQLYQSALTVINNDDDLIPLQKLEKIKIASIAIGEEEYQEFQNTLSLYNEISSFYVESITSTNKKQFIDTLDSYNTVVISLHNSDKNPWKKYRISKETNDFILELNKSKNVILVNFMNPYSLINFEGLKKINTVVLAYQNNKYTNHAAAELIYGAIGANGKLPVSISPKFKQGFGIDIEPMGRFSYSEPEEVGILEKELYQIDTIAKKGIKLGAYPGCQVFVAKEGKVIYNKSFGYHTYDSLINVKNTDIYDLASITKIASTLLGVMHLQDQEKFSLDSKLGDYLNKLIPDTSPYYNLNLREILAHQSGLQAWVPFYLKTIHNGELDNIIYCKDSTTYYPYRVADSIYISKFYPDIIYKRILKGPLKEKKYTYSDLGYYFLMKIVEEESKQKLNKYVGNIYAQLGMTTTTYLPRYKFSLDRIPPTEKDNYFRKQTIHGDVHDPGAAMLGGVGGHAGLFSNANDLAKLMQMYLNKGTYGGVQVLKDTTLAEFTKCQFCVDGNRRAAGFDKPMEDGKGGPTCGCVSYLSFGHTGFTGTIAWADPEEQVVYVFLSNRTYPDGENKKLANLNIRTDIQQVIYDAINNAKSRKGAN
ncbi:MAG: serine hydrolase [Flavobacteriales bacterium]|nr:serine hydrolase [Flavobacteriales bacterium]MCB9174308.1 serine hydrolase [Flavobacteriales bacterium]